jgi:flagellar protein FlaG
MGVEIPGVQPAIPREAIMREGHGRPDVTATRQRSVRQAPRPASIQSNLEKLEKTFLAFNKRLRFYVNEEIDRVIVKVIDAETDKVIKEIPPEEIQKLVARIRETIGILFDQEI